MTDFKRARRRFGEEWDDEPPVPRRRGKAVDDDPPAEPPSDPLFSVYGIFPNMPMRIKIEKLLMGWNMGVSDIAELLGQDPEIISRIVSELEDRWKSLGESLSDNAALIARGKYIAELQESLNQISQLYSQNQDAALLKLRLSILEKIAKLQGADTDRRTAPSQDETMAKTLEQKIAGLDPGQLKELYQKLSKKPSTPLVSGEPTP